MNIDYVSPQKLLQMTAADYLKKYGGDEYTDRQKAILCTRLNKNADKLRANLIGGTPVSLMGEPLVIQDLVRVPYIYLRHERIGTESIRFISEALERNELRLCMGDSCIEQYVESFDVNIAKLRTALEGVCQQCMKEKKRDFSRIFDRKKAIIPGFDCYVLVTRV